MLVLIAVLLIYPIIRLTRSYDQKLQHFISYNGEDNYYDWNDSEENVYARLTYNPDGIVIDKTYDYSFAMRFFDTKNSYKIEASIFFSLDQEEEREDQIFANFICATNLYYDEYSYVTCIYQNISWEYVYTGIGNIYHEDLNYGNYFYQKSNNWNNAYNYDENNWQSRGWQYVNTVFDELKEICDEAEFNIYDI